MNSPIWFDTLPEWLQEPIKKMRPNDYRTWINTPVPALRDRSVVEVLQTGKAGERELREYIQIVMSKFFY